MSRAWSQRSCSRRPWAALLAAFLLTLPRVAAAQARERVLVVGDSQIVETAGEVLDGLLRLTPTLDVTTRAVWGTHPGDWTLGRDLPRRRFFSRDPGARAVVGTGVRLEPLVELVARARPDLVVVALGANTTEVGSSTRRAQVAALVSVVEASGAACVWIGPPSAWARDTEHFAELYTDLVAALEGRCALVDSRALVDFPRAWGGDGMHLETASRMAATGRTRVLCEAEAEGLARVATAGVSPPSADDVCASGADLGRMWATAVYREVLRAYRRLRASRAEE